MRIWLACFGILFAIAELYEWTKHLTLPLPVYIVGGAVLAIASNYNKLANLPWQNSATESPPVMPSVHPPQISQSIIDPQPPRPIFFTVRRSTEDAQQSEPK